MYNKSIKVNKFFGENKMTITEATKKYNAHYSANSTLWDLGSLEAIRQIRRNYKEMQRLNDFIDGQIDKTSKALQACK